MYRAKQVRCRFHCSCGRVGRDAVAAAVSAAKWMQLPGLSDSRMGHVAGGVGMALTPTRARYSSACNRSLPARSTIRSVMSSEVETSLVLTLYSLGGAGIALTPTRARYSSACNRSFPARSRILSKLSIDETSSSCSVRNHWRKLIVM